MIIPFDWTLCHSNGVVQPEALRTAIRRHPAFTADAEFVIGVTATAARPGAELEIEFADELSSEQADALDACVLGHDAHAHGILIASSDCCPIIMSEDEAAASVQGEGITYTATAVNPVAGAEMTFALLPNGAGVTMDTATGAMSGGEAASVGEHELQFEVATTHGKRSGPVKWRVDAP